MKKGDMCHQTFDNSRIVSNSSDATKAQQDANSTRHFTAPNSGSK